MTNEELNCCMRFKELRKILGVKQGDFAKSLAISQGHASDIENGRKAVSDRIIEILVLKYNVNEKWIRCGQGEPLIKLSRNQIITDFAADLIKEDNSFKARLVEALARLSEEDWEVLERIAKDLANKKD